MTPHAAQVAIYSLNSDSFPANVFGPLSRQRQAEGERPCEEVGSFKLAWKFNEFAFKQMPRDTVWGEFCVCPQVWDSWLLWKGART